MGDLKHDTPDRSRNSRALTLPTGGQDLHNNHPRTPRNANPAYTTWEFDPGFLHIRVTARLRLISRIHDAVAAGAG